MSENDTGTSAFSAAAASAAERLAAARGKLVLEIREAADHRTREFAALNEQINDLDAEWEERVSTAWRLYDTALTLGLPEKTERPG